MSAQVVDLEFISQKMLDAIIRDEQLGEAAARKQNNHRQKNRLWCYIHDNRVPDPSGANT
jgi:hypothetical protein